MKYATIAQLVEQLGYDMVYVLFDGDSQNNIIDNLKLLCPNCHSLTKTWKNSGNRKSTRINRKK